MSTTTQPEPVTPVADQNSPAAREALAYTAGLHGEPITPVDSPVHLIEAAQHLVKAAAEVTQPSDWTSRDRFARYIAALGQLQFKATGPKQVTATCRDQQFLYLGQMFLDEASAELDMPPGEFTGDATATIFTWC